MLHALADGSPRVNGYTIRSGYLLAAQRASGAAVPLAAVSPFCRGAVPCTGCVPTYPLGHPADGGGDLEPLDHLCRGVYGLRRTLTSAARWTLAPRAGAVGNAAPGGMLWRAGERSVGKVLLTAEEQLLGRRFRRRLTALGRTLGADLLHAHSPYRCGLAAAAAARALGVPVVYEVRGLWEESGVADGRFAAGSPEYRRSRRLERLALARAHAVVCITESLRTEVIARGAAADRVFVVPNGVDADLFTPVPGGPAVDDDARLDGLSRRLGGCPVIGYAGSLRRLEGVDLLIRAIAELTAAGRDVRALVVGEGPEREPLERLARRLEIADRIVFTGAVDHRQMRGYYELVDIFAITRPDTPATRAVSPLKPLEAMAMGRVVVSADLPALREQVVDGETGLLYRCGDQGDLIDRLRLALDDAGLRDRLGTAARRWVVRDRSWQRLVARYPEVYAAARSVAERERE